MLSRKKILRAVLAGLFVAPLLGQAYERELKPRSLRDAFFVGRDSSFRSADFFKDYSRTFPVPRQGVHVERIQISTPFEQAARRARLAPDGYNPLLAEKDYQAGPERVVVEVTLRLTPSYPAHTPFHVPVHLGPIYLRDPDFWREFGVQLQQRGQVEPLASRGEPFSSCLGDGSCWLAGAVVTLEYDPGQVASRPTRILVLAPDGQRVEAEFDLGRLR